MFNEAQRGLDLSVALDDDGDHGDDAVTGIARNRLRRLVNEGDHRLAAGDIRGMDEFVASLNWIRKSVKPARWHSLISHIVVPHPVRSRIHEEPFSRRAFEKPRGYPGDALLLDLIYRDRPTTEPLTRLGARLHAWAEHQPGCVSVRERRTILAKLIDRVAAETYYPRILSLACGHLREAQCDESVRAGEIDEIVAVDHDVESLAVVDREQRACRVTPVHMSVRRFLECPGALGTFDLAYAAGLCDYLADDVASTLTAAMFDALRPGGVLLVANFAPELRDIGYMEAIMDWNLIYRSEFDVARLTSTIAPNAIVETMLSRDSGGNVVYLSIRKR